MASSSEFIILRKIKKSKPVSNIALQLIKKNWIKTTFIVPPEDLHNCKTINFIKIEDDDQTHDFISVETKDKYIELMTMHFNSALSVLKPYFNMNPNNEFAQIEIDFNTAKLMRQAIKYLLNRNYLTEFENILDNEFIHVFSSLIPIYKYIKYKQEIDLEIEEESSEGFCVLTRIYSVLSTFINLVEESEYSNSKYILIYNVY